MGENIIQFPNRFPSLPDFETALGHLVLNHFITAEQAYRQMASIVLPEDNVPPTKAA